MKLTLDDIKDKLRNRLIEYDGNITPHHLADIVEEARAIGLSEHDIAKLVPELDQLINWVAIKEEKRIEEETRLLKKQAMQRAAELLDALINFSFSDGVLEQHELAAIFAKAAELQQDDVEIAKKIYDKIENGGYKPYPNANLNVNDLKESLLSTSWYDAREYAAVKRRKTPVKTVPKPVKPSVPVPKVHLFEANKYVITKGESITLSWEVSGVDQFTISGLGKTNILKGKKSVLPEEDITYILNAGGVTRSLSITVKEVPKAAKWILGIIITLIVLGLSKCL